MNTQDEGGLGEVRSLMLAQLRALRDVAPGAALEQELGRSQGVRELGQTLINSAKVEVDFLSVTHGQSSGFFGDGHKAGTQVLPGNAPGIASITRHRIEG